MNDQLSMTTYPITPITMMVAKAPIPHNNLRGELIIVDDNSPDGTGELADTLAKKYPNITVIHRKVKSGLGSAYKAGFKRASGKIVMEMDADHSHNPRDIQDL